MSIAQQMFLATFAAIETFIQEPVLEDKTSAWANGTGYYDNAVRTEYAPHILPGNMARCTTLNGRKMILIGTRFGNVVIFTRYSDIDTVIVSNVPPEIREIMMGSAIGTNLCEDNITMQMLIGTFPMFNIGNKIENMFKMIK